MTILAVALLVWGSPGATAGFLVVESWEIPTPLGYFAFPSPWVGAGPQGGTNGGAFSSGVESAGTGPGAFNVANPLAAPADGNHYLQLGRSYSVSTLTGVTIQANREYTLSTAIGNSNYLNYAYAAGAQQKYWGISLWADTADLGSFDSSVDTFIGQEFGFSGTANVPAVGAWALNSFAFNSTTTPSLVGKELVIVLGNGDPAFSVSNFDNVTLSTPDAATATPLPPSVLLLAAGLLGLARWGVRTRRG